jgi:hypothetical protein
MVEVERIDAEAVHLGVALVDEPLALAAKLLEVTLPDDGLEDEEALVLKAAGVLAGEAGH